MPNLNRKIASWKELLLDLGKRNRLINLISTKRSKVLITYPLFDKLYMDIVVNEKNLSFPYATNIEKDEDGNDKYSNYIKGDIQTNNKIDDLQKTLRILRAKTKAITEEQGVNTLYLTFGLLKWKEKENSNFILSSPLILVPVRLIIKSISSPYHIELHEDEIVVNPCLVFKLQNDFGIVIPEFDGNKDDISNYLKTLSKVFSHYEWEMTTEVNLTMLSFLKINMYKDLERNEEKLKNNDIISTIVGDKPSFSLPNELKDYNHDSKTKPIDTYQVVDADSSQQDAILLSKQNISFVLQGPPGTGKSQTITNIISEALADGKKVLFVSEKMAALQVVYKRLKLVGISDFCLTLHSHKANKKAILKELSDSLHLNRTKVREEMFTKLSTLEEVRNELNKYNEELHTISFPLEKTIYDVNGILASLDNIAELIFSIDNVDEITSIELNKRINLLKDYSRIIDSNNGYFIDNPWVNANVGDLNNELRYDIDANFKSLIPKLNELLAGVKENYNFLDIDLPISKNNIDSLIKILSVTKDLPNIPYQWILKDDINALMANANNYNEMMNFIKTNTSNLLKKYSSSYLEFNAVGYNAGITNNIESIRSNLNFQKCENIDSFFDNLDDIIGQINVLLQINNCIRNSFLHLVNITGLQTPKNYSEFDNFVEIINSLTLKTNPTNIWFENNNDDLFNSFISFSKKKHEETNELINNILKDFNKEIFTINYSAFLQRFRTEYTSIFKYLKPQYRKDKKELKSHYTKQNRFNKNLIIEVLNSLKSLSERQEWINENNYKLKSYFGKQYQGLETDWNKINVSIQNFRTIVDTLKGQGFPEKLKELLLDDNLCNQEINEFISLTTSIKTENYISEVNGIFCQQISTYSEFTETDELITNVLYPLNELNNSIQEIKSISNNQIKLDTILIDLDILINIQRKRDIIEQRKNELISDYYNYWQEENTNWDLIIDSLNQSFLLKEIYKEYHLKDSIIKNICSDLNYKTNLNKYFEGLKPLIINISKEYDWIINLFDKEEDFNNVDFSLLIKRFSNCINNKQALEDWIDFRKCKENCILRGLSDFIEKIEDLRPQAEIIDKIYIKRFYKLWLDKILPKFPYVNSFRRRNYENKIADFKDLDKEQFLIAQSRVKEKLLFRIPDFNSPTSPYDEVGILKKELMKQRKIMPFRQLFNKIPNLLTSLKPCFMMSPLSVSIFLEADSYEFDLVIFDEASQVCTENAIGSIMRGKQVIIVGDSKQLPPTNFFTNTISNNDYDSNNEDDENEDDSGIYESILDEAITTIPEISLRWHYRSKNENLIAFSNAKIYNNSLITFPSSNEQKADIGVEYYYVQNGVYDRSGKRDNVIEAKKVAELVFEHFRKFPERSLGIVTFSVSQQYAIENLVNIYRLKNREYENFFDEEKEEPFFIKSLENVQGDERDTIIFSIGYAKDIHGVFYMNFGPLNKEGGYRRLNVAITRAKYNIKLVGSILHTDIDLEKTNSDGVKMLKKYIEFARNGISVLTNEINYTNTINLESPFEESVYNYLVLKGYNVSTQIGCSGYRIDMAINHPHINGEFVLGIECDGASYHSARIARERDRLRQTVLEDIGWKIYRIWSTDWIKDTKSEGTRLVNAIENAINSYDSPSLNFGCNHKTEIVTPTEEIEEVIISDYNKDTKINFDTYEEPNLDEIEFDLGVYSEDDLILSIIEKGQPIHFDNLSRIIAPFYGNKKLSSKIINNVEDVIRYLCNKINRDNDNFLTLKTMEIVVPRIPKDDKNIRPINFIAKEEIAEAMVKIICESYGIKRGDLKVFTARKFGFSRMGTNVSEAMDNAYNYLKDRNRIIEIDGDKVSIVQ